MIDKVIIDEIKKENSDTIKAKLLYIFNNKALDEAQKQCDIEDIAIKHKYDLLYKDIDNNNFQHKIHQNYQQNFH